MRQRSEPTLRATSTLVAFTITSLALADFLGLKITHVSPERVTAELIARDDDRDNRFKIMHGGALMALADNLGGNATTANLGPGQSTTTAIGDVAKAECTRLHRGPTAMVWQTGSRAAMAGSAPRYRLSWCSSGANSVQAWQALQHAD